MEDFRLKNYYMLETLKNEIPKYSVITFDLFDTLLLYDILLPTDVLLPVEEFAQENYHVTGFSYMQAEIAQAMKARLKSPKEEINYTDLFAQIADKIKIDCGEISKKELEELDRHTFVNPVMRQLYDFSVQQNKQIYLVADTIYPASFIKELLHKKGLHAIEKLFLSGETGLTKITGNLYRHVLETEQLDPKAWLHIGANWAADVEALRQTGVSAYFYRAIRDRYTADKEKTDILLQDKDVNTSKEKPQESALLSSMKKAKILNDYYTEILEPLKDVIVHVENVSMMFNLSSEKVDSIKEYMIKLLRRELMFQEFWALKNVSFDVHKGEKVGLVGLNGSGKSTMLKIVSGVMTATKGLVSVRGTVAPLIELGAGFDLDLTARENIFLNGSILGYRRKEMEKRYQEIIDFSELKEFENVPIKNFSSGMTARLGFAIATCHVPDILIIDEILSVGDFEFQKKCQAKMAELAGKGTTVLFVSHSASDIISMCDKAVWLDHGRVVDFGEAEFIVNKYLNH